MRGGANGARIRLSLRRRIGRSTSPPSARRRFCRYPREASRKTSTAHRPTARWISLADIIVLGGSAAVEQAARKDAGQDVDGALHAGPIRRDASQEQTDVESFAVLELDRGRLPQLSRRATVYSVSAEELLVDRAQLLTLTGPEMTVLVGGLRVLERQRRRQSKHGVFTDRPETLSNDFFVNLLDMGTTWKATVDSDDDVFEGPQPRDGGRSEVDRHAGRPHLRVQLPAPGPRRGLRLRRRGIDLRARLRRGLGQGHEPRSVRLRTTQPA